MKSKGISGALGEAWLRGSLSVAVLPAVMLAVLLAARPAPAFTGSHEPSNRPTDGYDLAVVAVGTTGPDWEPMNAPVITIENRGWRAAVLPIVIEYTSNGEPAPPARLSLSLQPGQSISWQPLPDQEAHAGRAEIGDLIEVVIDADDRLPEEDEENNRLTVKIAPPAPVSPSAEVP